MSADEEEAKGSSVPMEASDGEIIFPENENRILSRCNSDGCPICFGVFGKLLLFIDPINEFLGSSIMCSIYIPNNNESCFDPLVLPLHFSKRVMM